MMKPTRPIIIIPKPDALTIVLNSSMSGFLVIFNTLLHSLKNLLILNPKVGLNSCSSIFIEQKVIVFKLYDFIVIYKCLGKMNIIFDSTPLPRILNGKYGVFDALKTQSGGDRSERSEAEEFGLW